MTVTPKNGWENTAPARSYECSVYAIKFYSYRHTSPPLFSASQRQMVAAVFASDVPSKSLEKLIVESAGCGEIPQRTWCFATASWLNRE